MNREKCTMCGDLTLNFILVEQRKGKNKGFKPICERCEREFLNFVIDVLQISSGLAKIYDRTYQSRKQRFLGELLTADPDQMLMEKLFQV